VRRGSVEVIRITPRGYCYGVVDAMTLARRAAKDPTLPRPITVLGYIVHNSHAVGEDRLALLEQVEAGTVIFTAHGVSPAVRARAREKGLFVLDATCPDVTRTHDIIRDLVARGTTILYVGKKGHPEPEGAIGEAPPGTVFLVEGEADLEELPELSGPVAVVTQTTLSQWDTAALIEAIRQRYPHVQVYNEICRATQERQEAAVKQSADADLVLVVGDERSNNSNRLVQVVREVAGRPAYLVDSVEAIRPEWLQGVRKVAVTAGSSTPSPITRAVIQYLEALPEEPSSEEEKEEQDCAG
jgi:4-hydroxy-3-methylbut-2-enyl diphosphate reductase